MVSRHLNYIRRTFIWFVNMCVPVKGQQTHANQEKEHPLC